MKTARWTNTATKYIGGFIAVLGFIVAVVSVIRGDNPNSALITYLLGFTCLVSAEVNELKWERRADRKAIESALKSVAADYQRMSLSFTEQEADRNARGGS